MTPTRSTTALKNPLMPPGGIMIWAFIVMELLVFGMGFVAFAVLRSEELALFEASQAELDQTLALLNTLVLLTSGYFVVLANGCYERGLERQSVRWLVGAIGMGVLFVLVKLVEYDAKVTHGLTTGVNTFFDFYWLLTAFHLFHVLVGFFVLAYMARKIHRGDAFEAEDFNLKTGSAFWHMCDLIWVLLFPLLYLL